MFKDDRAVTMDDIVEASGLGRTTVFRHFRRRDDLLEVLLALIVTAVEERIDEPPLELLAAGEALEYLANVTVALADRFGLAMALQLDISAYPECAARFATIEQRVVALCARAQSEGVLQQGVSPEWLTTVFFGIANAIFEAAAQGSIDIADANTLFLQQFLRGAGGQK